MLKIPKVLTLRVAGLFVSMTVANFEKLSGSKKTTNGKIKGHYQKYLSQSQSFLPGTGIHLEVD